MFVPFEQLPGNARLWVYQADRNLDTAQEKDLSNCLTDFCEQWNVHGQPLRTSFVIQHHRFVILAVDVNHNEASGCSIDGSVRVLKSFGQTNGINLLDRSQVAFADGGTVHTYSLTALKELFANGKLAAQSQLIDTLVATKDEFTHAWTKRVEDSWLRKYLPKKVVADS